ncbi:putative disease resistance RPP13-like protein 1 [Corylus avellana]|uniref:putative disease resistance RPP13-like protein 1 n=1 Tax=Corylus avellana TaxID=13451 RepID=UPI00286D53DC|nr:putative disease resistance RPP13-like protein 1 [Corylus avellana]
MGGLLRSKEGVDEWEKILKSELWDSPIDKTDILPALRLSYKYLPSHLKQCFAYCSVFPKDYVLEKDEVVLLWMAEGFLEETRNKGMEEVGEDYFLDLASRSLLEQSSVKKSECKDLFALPRDMRKLINLRHLDISGTGITEMPMQLGRLKRVQTLSKFIISKHSGACIEELGKLANLRGKLFISELQNDVSPTNALKACLKDRKYLEELVLEWNSLDTNISDCQRSVLDNLRPHSNLKSLTINNYGAESLPDWVGHLSYSKIVSLHLKNCKLCPYLPSLGELPSLEHLSIVGFEGIVKVAREFYANNSSTVKPFGALKVLRFERMLNWEEWSSFGAENEGRAFSQLKELYIIDCPKLIGGLPVDLPSAVKLEIHECPLLVASLPKAPVV